MTGDASRTEKELNQRFLLDHPFEAALCIEQLSASEASDLLVNQSSRTLSPVWQKLNPGMAAEVLVNLPGDLAVDLLTELFPTDAIRLIGLVSDDDRERLLGLLDPDFRSEFEALMAYPPDSAGRLMDTRYSAYRGTMTADEALAKLRASPSKTTRSLFLIGDDNRLAGRVLIQDVAVAQPDQPLSSIALPVLATVNAVAPQHDVAASFDEHKLADLPVIDLEGRLLGVIYHATLIQTVQEDATVSLQTMVGASKDERALSTPLFAVKKRLPWLQINLLTAFAAASVVGLFEDTIARFTALAVLLPVVAGQSGNAGAQALAVTMRGLALREITTRSWFRVMSKEAVAGFMNGLAVALTCGIGVFVWSGSVGLVLVIAVSMVLAMVAAGFAGALVPIVLTRLGQDPAQSSSIILTTVTDIAGFFSFLGIATVLAGIL